MPKKPIPVLDVAAFGSEILRNERFLFESPCVVEGHATDWPGFRRWSDLQFLKTRFGNTRVKAGAPQFTTALDQPSCEVETTFSEYLDYLQDQRRAAVLFKDRWRKGSLDVLKRLDIPLYCGSLRFVRNPADARIQDLSPLLPRPLDHWNDYIPYFYTLYNHFWLYVSAPGALTPLHTDNNFVCTYLAQLKGRKHVRLYAPEDAPKYFLKGYGYVDPERADSKLFPCFHEATCWEAELAPGQMLFFGPRWAHQARTLDNSVTFSFDFINQSNVDGFIDCGEWFSALANFWNSIPNKTPATEPAPMSRETSLETGRQLAAELLERKLGNSSESAHRAVLGHLLELTRAAGASCPAGTEANNRD